MACLMGGSFSKSPRPLIQVKTSIVNDRKEEVRVAFTGMRFEESFLTGARPRDFREVVRQFNKRS